MHNTDSSSSEIVTRKKCSSCGQEVGHTRSLEADTQTTLTRCRPVSEPFRVACCLFLSLSFSFDFAEAAEVLLLRFNDPRSLCYCCPLSSLFFLLFTLYYYYFARITTTTTSDHCCGRRRRRSSVVRLSFSPTAAATTARLLGPLLCFIIYLFI